MCKHGKTALTYGAAYSVGEARLVAKDHMMDPYHRELMLFLCDLVEQLSGSVMKGADDMSRERGIHPTDQLRVLCSMANDRGLFSAAGLLNSLIERDPKMRYYKIIGGHIGEPIGKCPGSSIADVLAEEPDSTFEEITQAEFEAEDDDE